MRFNTRWMQSGIFGYPSNLYLTFLSLFCLTMPNNSLLAQGRTITADVVVLEQPIILNRLGSLIPNGTMYALANDIMADTSNNKGLIAGNVMLKPDKRPRPLVLRANMGDTIIVRLTNFLTPQKDPSLPKVGFSVNGMQNVVGTVDNGSWIGSDTDNQASPQPTLNPDETKVYTLLAQEEGSYLMRDPSSSLTSLLGLFGSITVQPEQAEWYRSQVTNEDLYYATDHWIGENGTTISKQQAINNGQVSNNQVVETIGYPIIDYQATFPASHPKAGQYVLRMLDDANNIIYSDLTAIITGPNNGRFLDSQIGPLFDSIPASPDRRQPYREICIHYHNPLTASQAFADTLSDLPTNTLEGTDIFGINYAAAGIVNEIAANRFKVGAMADCIDCKYEEFFLSSWSAGDPAMVPNVDATTTLMEKAHPKAEYVKYADDPSNVYHAYLWDHTKMRINHANPLITHVHHFHAHQWLHSPNDPSGHYLDSQTINPGASWSLELVHNGAGNKNLTSGDNIFHCHFYPHFASGMWGLFRVHDVLELGTRVAGTAGTTPIAGSRAYPDGEIMTGTPIPALVPLPTKAMAPVPAEVKIEQGQVVVTNEFKNPGYPFFIPGIAGSRPPHPPLDFAVDNNEPLDGGLPRHIIKGGDIIWEKHTTTDWTKLVDTLIAIELPEEGTPVEKVAMRFHERLHHSTYRPDNGDQDNFRTNGMPAVSGAPYANPAEDIYGNPQGTKRTYKAANIQMDVVLNKQGWHFPQQRMIALWEDVAPTIAGTRPPEPFFFRAKSFEFIEFWHTNLVPDYYELDDFQVRTPTDVLGQHIHLVKFDVTSSDGAANGFNYEDGTFSPNEVQERIKGINNGTFLKYTFNPQNSLKNSRLRPVGGNPLSPNPPNPVWGKAPVNQNWSGAQTTIQRWYADPLYNLEGQDRTIRTVFTHDHFSPSTHQQIGLYAGLLVEPANSRWYNTETGEEFGNLKRPKTVRDDGGPTSFQAIIRNNDDVDCSYREFALEFQDLAMAYTADSRAVLSPYPQYQPSSSNPNLAAKHQAFTDSVGNYTGWRDPVHAIAPPVGPQVIAVQGGNPLIFSNYSLNYRNEPLTLRASQPTPYSLGNYAQTSGLGGDLAYIYSSDTTIANQRGYKPFSKQPALGSKISRYNNFTYPKQHLTPGMTPGDPYTPLLRVYENDKVQIRTLVGAHEIPHIFNIHGLPWLFEPSAVNSGYRSTQMMSISEHFEMNFTIPGNTAGAIGVTDYLYNASSDNNGLNTGIWGLIRAYPKNSNLDSLAYIPSNRKNKATVQISGCPSTATVRQFEVGAYLVGELTNGKPLVYNNMDTIFDPKAMVFIKEKEIFGGKAVFERSQPIEHIDPMVLRAIAGECIQVNLTNRIDTSNPVFEELVEIGFKNQLALGRELNVHVTASGHVGLHPELLSYHSNQSDGANIGLNDVQTAAPNGGTASYSWYAGKWKNGKPVPIEFGSVLLTSADPMEQYARGLFGAVIVEPKGASWETDEFNPTTATVTYNGNEKFREFVIFHQDNLLLSTTIVGKNGLRDTVAVPPSAGVTVGINYKTAPFPYRYFTNNQVNDGSSLSPDIHAGTANNLVFADPATPIFAAGSGTPIRIRLIKPGGPGDPETFILDGHIWQEEPYKDSSTVLGYNPNSQWLGSRPQLAALNNFDLLIPSAGGELGITGDYKYFPYFTAPFEGGAWGLVRVTGGKDAITLTRVEQNSDGITFNLYATTTVDVRNGDFKQALTLSSGGSILNSANSLGYAGNGTKSWMFSNLPNSLLSTTTGIAIQSGTDGSQITTDSDALNALIPTGHPRAIPNDSHQRLQQFLLNQPFNRPNRAKSDRK